MRPKFVTADGCPMCQAYGCNEAAKPWGYVVDFGEVEVEIFLCYRHQFLTGEERRRVEQVEA